MASPSPVVVTNRKVLTKLLEQDAFVAMPKARYDALVERIEYLEEIIEALKDKIQDTRSLEEIVEQYEDELDDRIAASPTFRKYIAEARADYAAGKGGDWNEITRRRKRKRK